MLDAVTLSAQQRNVVCRSRTRRQVSHGLSSREALKVSAGSLMYFAESPCAVRRVVAATRAGCALPSDVDRTGARA